MIAVSLGFQLLAAACSITWESLVSSSIRDPALTSMELRQSTFDTTGRYLWEEIEARWKLDDLDKSKHDVSIRISPAPWGSYQASRDLVRAQSGLLSERKNALRQNLLARRLIAGAEHLHRIRKRNLIDTLFQVASDRIRIHLERQGNVRFDPQDLVLTQQDAAELEAERVGLDMQLKSSAAKLRLLSGCQDSGDIFLDPARVRDPDDLLRTNHDQKSPEPEQSPLERLATGRLDVAQARLRLEESSSSQILSYLETGTTLRPHPDGFEVLTKKDWMVGAGIRLPFGDGRSEQVVDRRLDVVSAATDRMERFQETREELRRLEDEVQALAIEYSTMETFRKRSSEGSLWSDFARLAGGDPLLLLRAREQELRSAVKMNGILLELETDLVNKSSLSGSLEDASPLLRPGSRQ